MKHTHNKIIEQRIYNIIREDDENTFVANLVDTFLMILVIISVIVAFLNTFEISTEFKSLLNGTETVFVILFTIEYILRLWTAELIYPDLSPTKARLKYARSGMALIDLFSILPFYLPFFGISVGTLKVIKLVRLLRIFKINRYTNSLTLIGRVLKTRASQLASSIIVIVVLIFVASMLMYDVEHVAQPDKFNNALSAMWWAMSTITTVGYGDIYPITSLGRILSAVITFLGIGLTAIPTGIVSAGFIEQSKVLQQPKNSKLPVITDEMSYCPCCGQPLQNNEHE
ncbi:ion transporter [Erysipelothrix sp. HDW6C]|uniref:ion transporter n=1 Tax=Erysipelothrix sp. HDW6C TaxID=2714930 RepID=UPI0014073AD8|nr:ion transporter [Erysipelothrix sp. HDW6C]QIK70624.1 ion transporter [Erysipelothrix sp. HDW6C]